MFCFCSSPASAVPYLSYTPTMPLRFISLNVKGISNYKKKKTNNIHLSKTQCRYNIPARNTFYASNSASMENEWGAKLISSHASSNSRGVAIMIKNNLDCTIHHTVIDPMGRYIILKADIKDTTYLLINVYAPNKDKDLIEFF